MRQNLEANHFCAVIIIIPHRSCWKLWECCKWRLTKAFAKTSIDIWKRHMPLGINVISDYQYQRKWFRMYPLNTPIRGKWHAYREVVKDRKISLVKSGQCPKSDFTSLLAFDPLSWRPIISPQCFVLELMSPPYLRWNWFWRFRKCLDLCCHQSQKASWILHKALSFRIILLLINKSCLTRALILSCNTEVGIKWKLCQSWWKATQSLGKTGVSASTMISWGENLLTVCQWCAKRNTQ